MFIQNTRRRGRPPGATDRGRATEKQLYEAALARIAEVGFEKTTLRDIARDVGVSPGLLYRYFPSKQAVVLAFYDRLSLQYADSILEMPSGPWRARFEFALRTSIRVLDPHRVTLRSLIPVLVGAGEQGLFAPRTSFSRVRVQRSFEEAVVGAEDAPDSVETSRALGRLLYLFHLGVLLFWLLDASSDATATSRLLDRLGPALRVASLGTRLGSVRRWLVELDQTVRSAFYGEDSSIPSEEVQR